MPYRSKKQARWAHATHQKFARKWDKLTDFSSLPASKDAGTDAGAPLHGPGGLLAAPGLGTRRRWGIRTKANYSARAGETITGNLKRGGDGKFASAGSASGPAARGIQLSKQPKPTTRTAPTSGGGKGGKGKGGGKGAKPKKEQLTPEQRQAAREAEQAQNRADVLGKMNIAPDGQQALSALRSGEQPDADAIARGGFEQAGLVERAQDGSFRLTGSGRALLAAADAGDAGRAGDTISSGRDRTSARTERQTAAQAKRAAAEQKRQQRAQEQAAAAKKPAGGGSSAKQPKDDATRAADRDTRREVQAGETARKVGLGSDVLLDLRNAATAGGGTNQELIDRGLIGPDGFTTDQGRRALTALERGDVRGYQAALQDARARQERAQAAEARRSHATEERRWRASMRTKSQRAKAVAPTRTLDAGHTGVMAALYPDSAAIKALSSQEGVTEPPEQMHLTLAFLGDSTETPLSTNKEPLITAMQEWAARHNQALKGTINGLGRFFHSEDDGTNAVFVSPDVPGLPELRQSLVQWIERSGFDYAQNHGFTPHITVAYVAEDAPTPTIRVETPVTFDRLTLAWGDEQYEFPFQGAPQATAQKSFAVFKDASGAYRWIARTTTAYRDRDGEILATDALDADSQRMMATKQFGPLRYWHIGAPDPSDPEQPWGPGVDLGECDFSMVIGRTRVESGTFKSAQIARQVAAVADRHEMSPGFFHPEGHPGPDNVFTQMRTFERSLVPVAYARASNLYTGFTVKEHRMDPAEMERRFKAAIAELGLDAEQASALGQALVQTEKAAQAQGVAYKSTEETAESATVYTAPDGSLGIIQDGQFVTLKAASPPPPPEADDAAMELQADDDMVEEMDDTDMPDVIGNMEAGAFAAMLSQAVSAAVAPLVKALDITGKLGGQVEELKTMFSTKEEQPDVHAAEIASLKEQQQQLIAKLAELEGDAPAVGLSPDAEAALKSAGPTTPEAAKPEYLTDPSRPLAAIAARTMPDLYRTGPDGGFAGWTPPPLAS